MDKFREKKFQSNLQRDLGMGRRGHRESYIEGDCFKSKNQLSIGNTSSLVETTIPRT